MKVTLIKSSKEGMVVEKDIDMEKVTGDILITLMLSNIIGGNVVYANSVSRGLQPIIQILKDIAEPVSYGFMIKGFMKIMSGDESEGFKTIKHAVGGYIGIQWIPMIFSVIKGIKF